MARAAVTDQRVVSCKGTGEIFADEWSYFCVCSFVSETVSCIAKGGPAILA
jgi:hypothetical protein